MKILCVGDSHSALIGIKPSGTRFRYGRICPTHVPGFDQANILSLKGGTAVGFRRKNTLDSTFAIARRTIRRLDPDVICFGFGQVDAEQGCYYVALRDGTSIQDAVTAKTQMFRRYLRFCMRAAKDRQVVIKGLNTTTLHDTAALHRMIWRNLSQKLQVPRRQVARWLVDNNVDIASHCAINISISETLRKEAEAASLAYFDLRSLTALPDPPGLTMPELCGARGDVHLARTPEIEAAFANALATAVYREGARTGAGNRELRQFDASEGAPPDL